MPEIRTALVVNRGVNAAQIEADLAAGGLTDVAIDRVVLHGHSPSADRLAEGFCPGTPLRFPLEKRGDLRTLSDAVAREMTARLGDGPIEGGPATWTLWSPEDVHDARRTGVSKAGAGRLTARYRRSEQLPSAVAV